MFRFTIRDVLWLTVVVALIVGWTLDHRRLVAANKYIRDLMGITDRWLPAVER